MGAFLRKGLWVSGALATNPSSGDILATTGALEGGWYLFSVNIHASTGAIAVIAQRNAENSADVYSYEIPIPADTDIPVQIPVHLHVYKNERFVIRIKTGITGTIQGSIFYANVVG